MSSPANKVRKVKPLQDVTAGFKMKNNAETVSDESDLTDDCSLSEEWSNDEDCSQMKDERLTNGTDRQLAELFPQEKRDFVKFVEIERGFEAHVHCEKKALWKEFRPHAFKGKIADFFDEKHRDLIAKCKEKEDREKAENLRERMGNGGCTRIFNALKTQTNVKEDSEFKIETLNKTHTDLLPMKNKKVVNLRDGSVRDRKKEDHFSFELNIECNEGDLEKKTPHADKFFKNLMVDDEENCEHLRLQLGHGITGETKKKKAFIWCGPKGCNGKSTLCRLLQNVFGDFCGTVEKSVFFKKNGAKSINRNPSGHTACCEPLVSPARIHMISELDSQHVFKSAFFKQVTGEDPLIHRGCRSAKNIKTKTKGKMFIATNHLPKITEDDDAMKRRISVTLFQASFKRNDGEIKRNEERANEDDENDDKNFMEKLEKEKKSEMFVLILRGAVDHHRSHHDRGEFWKQEPSEFLKEKNKMFKVDNNINEWLEENAELVDVRLKKEKRTDLHNDHKNWCRDDGEKIQPNSTFHKFLKEKGCAPKKINGDRYFAGIALTNKLHDKC